MSVALAEFDSLHRTWLSHQRVLVVGLGSIGRRHFANLRQLGSLGALGACSASGRLPEDAADCRLYGSLDEAIMDFRPTIGFVANAAPAHISAAAKLAAAGAHLFIEKPISDSVAGIDELIAAGGGRTTMVGYTLRFVPAVMRTRELLLQGAIGRPLFLTADVGQFLPDWRPGSDYRLGVSARRDLGGGVLLELSHEIDYVRWMLGEPESVIAITGRSGVLDIDVEDSADVLLGFPQGARARIHLDFLEQGKSRRCRIVGTEGTIETDLVAGTVQLTALRLANAQLETPEPADPYARQMCDFLAAAAAGRPSAIPLAEGLATLELVETIRRSAERRAMVPFTPSAAGVVGDD